MTKYILHGGAMRKHEDGCRALFTELVDGYGQNPNLLMCFFAEPEGVWAAKYEEWRQRIAEAVAPLTPKFELATIADFVGQSERNDVLFLYGGTNEAMNASFSSIDVHSAMANFGTILGSSAGAILLAEDSWGCDRREMSKGQGIVEVKTIVHYESTAYDTDPRGPIDWKAAYELCQSTGDPNMMIYGLHEAEYVVISQ